MSDLLRSELVQNKDQHFFGEELVSWCLLRTFETDCCLPGVGRVWFIKNTVFTFDLAEQQLVSNQHFYLYFSEIRINEQ